MNEDLTISEINEAIDSLQMLAVQYRMSDTKRDHFGAEMTAIKATDVLEKVRARFAAMEAGKKSLKKVNLRCR